MSKLLRHDRDQQTGSVGHRRRRLDGLRSYERLATLGVSRGKNSCIPVAAVHGRLLFYLAEAVDDRALKELGKLAGGIHHNAVDSAIRRFSERIPKDRALIVSFP
jgi:hypothetical protein